MAENLTTKVVVPCRFSYAHVFQPQAINDGDEKKYSVNVIIPKADKKTAGAVKKAIDAAYAAGVSGKFGGKKPAKWKNPLRDGDEDRPDDEVYAGAYFINASCKTRPGVVNVRREPIMDENEFYSGCYGYASITFYAFNTSGNIGVAAGLNNVMKTRDGEHLGGRVSAEVDFAEVVVEEEYDFL